MRSAAVGSVLCVLLGLGLVPVTAQAVGTGDPRIVSPVAGQFVPQGWTGPVQVDFGDAEVGTYAVQVECPPGEGEAELSDYLYKTELTYDGTRDDYQTTIPPISTPASSRCEVAVTAPGLGAAYVWFHVEARTLTMTSVSASPTVFYPLVQDSYRDSTRLQLTLSKRAGVRVRIRNSSGNTVRYANLGSRVGAESWAWFGYRNNGAKAAPGRYSVELVARDALVGTVRRVTKLVRIATTVQTLRTTREHIGDSVTGSAVSGPCSMTRDFVVHTTALACRGGGYAQAWFRFVVPASAHAARGAVVGRTGPGTTGTITQQVERIGSRYYRVGLRVTGTRSFDITSVRLTYSYLHRI